MDVYALAFMMACGKLLCYCSAAASAMSGQEESEDNTSMSTSDAVLMTPAEKMKIMGVTVRDLRLSGLPTMQELKPRQIAYALAGSYPWILPTDLLEIGGELETWMMLVCCSLSVDGVLLTLSQSLV